MKNLYLIRGISGAGKSTFVKSVIQDGDMALANDDFMVNDAGDYEFDFTRLDEVGQKCREATEAAMKEGTHRIFVHNTFTTEAELEPYLTLAKKHNYQVHSLIIEQRHSGISSHNVPKATLKRQTDRFSIKLSNN